MVSMKRFLIACSCIAILGVGCFRFQEDRKKYIPEPDFKSIPEEFTSLEESGEAIEEAPKDLAVPPEEPNILPGEIASVSSNVIVSSIVPNQALLNPFVILGRARAFENVIHWRVRDLHRRTIGSGSAMTNAPEPRRFGSFRVRVFYEELPEADEGTVEIFTRSPYDGSEQDMVSIPVRLVRDLLPVRIYFSNVTEDPNQEQCEKVYPFTRRTVETTEAIEVAVLELMKGPTASEIVDGARTSLLPNTRLISLSLENGVATLDFSREFVFALAGECNKKAIRAQIHQTLMQFKDVEVVRILVEGEDTAKLLQP